MSGSIATTPGAPSRQRGLDGLHPAWIGGAFAVLAIAVYVLSNPERQDFYNHFVWQAQAWLDGRAAITWPVPDNDYFQDVYPVPGQPGFGLIPFPPLPAVVLLPFVGLFGLDTSAALVAAVLGGLNVGLCCRMLTRVSQRVDVVALGTVFYGFGTVAWYAAMLGSTWFLAHVVASSFLFLAITAALDAERSELLGRGAKRIVGWIDVRQFVAGLLLGMAGLSRLTTIFGAPFLVFVGGGGSYLRRAVSAGLGAAIPVGLLLTYNLATTGHAFHPAYEYLYQNEYTPRPDLLHRDEWAIEDPRYVPQNAVIMLLWPPLIEPECGLELLDPDCALIRPDPLGMSILLTSPGYLLALPAVISYVRRRRLVAGAVLAAGAIALVNLMHFSQGWVQFGYRFSNDLAPFAMIPVALGIARLGVRPLTITAVALSVAINAWGVYWGVVQRW